MGLLSSEYKSAVVPAIRCKPRRWRGLSASIRQPISKSAYPGKTQNNLTLFFTAETSFSRAFYPLLTFNNFAKLV